ncbi:MAG: D-alanine-D-alanine ligase [Pseudomonadota bacterium]|jgi:D-alanine-D-alanine ligase
MKKLRVLCLAHETLVPPDHVPAGHNFHNEPWRTEHYVLSTLKKLGHEAIVLGVRSDLELIRSTVVEFKPDIIFNLLEEFHDRPLYDQNVVSFLELIPVPYTGCNPRGMVLSRDKALTRKILSYHRIPGPDFTIFRRGRKVKRPTKLTLPLFVKSQVEEASLGISQASVVHSDEELIERVRFMHDKYHTDVIAEEYIEGREIYVGIFGDDRLTIMPIWELLFANMPEDKPRIATRRVKWNAKYQEKHGISSGPALGIAPELRSTIESICKRAYRALGISGYARIDLRLKPTGEVYVIEANPNPEIAKGEDFADAAQHFGWSYEELIKRILSQGLHRS